MTTKIKRFRATGIGHHLNFFDETVNLLQAYVRDMHGILTASQTPGELGREEQQANQSFFIERLIGVEELLEVCSSTLDRAKAAKE